MSKYPDVIIVDAGEMWEEEKRFTFFQRPETKTDDEWDAFGDHLCGLFQKDTGLPPNKTIGFHKFWETTNS